MKNIVVNDEYRASDLKPSLLLQEYVTLLQKDVAVLLTSAPLKDAVCPACASAKSIEHFEKFGMSYKECADCQSLYIAPRPSDAVIARFFRQAPSKIFWRNQLSEASRVQRKVKIIKPRFEWITDSTAEYLPRAEHWVDLHTGQARYLEAMAAAPFARKTVIYPYCDVLSSAGMTVIDKPWGEAKLSSKADIVTLFEVIDHASDVPALLARLKDMLNDGGLCFTTAILASGFDIKELGRHAKNIYPPDRLNVFTVKGLKGLFERHGFECLELSTPGILDLEIVAAALKEDPAIVASAFIRDLAINGSDGAKHAFQEFLQADLLSSYGRILIRKT